MLVAISGRCKPSPWIATLLLNIAFFSDTFVSPGHSIPTDVASDQVLQGWDSGDDGYYANKHAYFELPLKELTKLIPELKKLKPATDQQMLPTILRKTGLRVDDFFHSAVDLIADEDTTENGIYARHRVRNSYLILRKAGGNGVVFNEYREDAEGNRPDQWKADHGFFISIRLCYELHSLLNGGSIRFSVSLPWRRKDRQTGYICSCFCAAPWSRRDGC